MCRRYRFSVVAYNTPGRTDDQPTDRVDDELDGLEGRLLVDRYRVLEVVSVGANTVITVAADTAHVDTELADDAPGRLVTLKIVRPELAGSPQFARAFRRAAELGQALTHPNVATVLDWGAVELDGRSSVYWTAEHLSGGSLRDLFDRGRFLTPSQALVVGLEACRALESAHHRGVVHTEITPSKLVFGGDGRLRVVDFGMAALLGAPAWAEPATVPTHVARYASPEQALGMPVEPKSDVYALAVVLLEAVTGKVPFASDSTVATLSARIGKLLPVSADLGSLAAVLERAARPEAEERFSAAEFGQALVQAASSLPRPEPVPILATSLFLATPLAAAASAGVVADGETADGGADERAGDVADRTETTQLADTAETTDSAQLAAADVKDDTAGADDSPVSPESDTVTGDQPTDLAGEGAPLTILPDAAEPAIRAAEPGDDETATDTQPPVAATTQMPVAPPPVAPAGELYDEERPRRRVLPIVLVTLVVLAGLAGLAYAGWLLVRTESYEVPDLRGVQLEVALNEISGNDWEIVEDRARSDEYPEPDTVISTDPEAGVQLDEGEEFVLVVSDGPEFRTLPDFTGSPLDEARTTIEELALVPVEAAERVFSETAPVDEVVSWEVQGDTSLGAGSQVLPGRTIVLTVSQGPEPRPAPELANLTVDEATSALEALQLEIARGDDVFSDDVEAGRVVSQEPAPGTAVERGGTVTVQVSKGPDLVAVPELDGLSYAAAEQLLVETGFTIGDLLGTTEGTFVSISVDGEEVEPGQQFRRGTVVDLIFL